MIIFGVIFLPNNECTMIISLLDLTINNWFPGKAILISVKEIRFRRPSSLAIAIARLNE